MPAPKPNQPNDKRTTRDKTVSKPQATNNNNNNNNDNNQMQQREHLEDIRGSIITLREVDQMIKEIVPHLQQTRRAMENQLQASKNKECYRYDKY